MDAGGRPATRDLELSRPHGPATRYRAPEAENTAGSWISRCAGNAIGTGATGSILELG